MGRKPQTFMIDDKQMEQLRLVQKEIEKKRLAKEPSTSYSDIVNDAIEFHLKKFDVSLETHLELLKSELYIIHFIQNTQIRKDFIQFLLNSAWLIGNAPLKDFLKEHFENWIEENFIKSLKERENELLLEEFKLNRILSSNVKIKQ